MRQVTERDIRMPEFRDAKLEDLEFRSDGKIVRKDRWETAIHQIREILGDTRREFEIEDIVSAVAGLVALCPTPHDEHQPGKRFAINGGIVTDTETGLMWKLDREEGFFTFDKAVEKLKNVQFAGHDDWRLPTIDELKSLTPIDYDVFPDSHIAFWSASECSEQLAWYFSFFGGNVDSYYRGNNFAVRLVRASQGN